MKGNNIASHVPMLDSQSNIINAGWARHMYWQYNARKIVCAPMRLKEWDFYQINDHRYVLQMTIGHVSYASSVSATLLDITTGNRYTFGSTKALPMLSMGMNSNGEQPHYQHFVGKNFAMTFDVAEHQRHLALKAMDNGKMISIDVVLTNCSHDKDKMTILTPFAKARQFYLNYKENCYNAVANITIGNSQYCMGVDTPAYGLLDWGRGVWPYSHQWVWGNGSTVVDGKSFGYNIGYGFGDTTCGSENMFFYDNVGYKLDKVTIDTGKERKKNKWIVQDNQGLFYFEVTPIFDNFTTTKLLVVNNSCHQIFGWWSGYVVLNGVRISVPAFVGFCEWANNRW